MYLLFLECYILLSLYVIHEAEVQLWSVQCTTFWYILEDKKQTTFEWDATHSAQRAWIKNGAWKTQHHRSKVSLQFEIWITKNETFVATPELRPSHVTVIYIIFFLRPTWNLCCMEHCHYNIHKLLYECNPIQIEKYPKGFAFLFSSPFLFVYFWGGT